MDKKLNMKRPNLFLLFKQKFVLYSWTLMMQAWENYFTNSFLSQLKIVTAHYTHPINSTDSSETMIDLGSVSSTLCVWNLENFM